MSGCQYAISDHPDYSRKSDFPELLSDLRQVFLLIQNPLQCSN